MKDSQTQQDSPMPRMPLPFEALKMQADYAKWLAGVATLIIATSPTLVGGKLSGLWFWPYYGAILLLVVSVASTGTVLIALSHLVQAFELGTADPSHFKTGETLTRKLKEQVWTFTLGLCFFVIAVAGAANHDLAADEQRQTSNTAASAIKPSVAAQAAPSVVKRSP